MSACSMPLASAKPIRWAGRARISRFCPPASPVTRIDIDFMCPHAALGCLRPSFRTTVAVAVACHGTAFPDEPFVDVSTLAGNHTDQSSVAVLPLDMHMHMPSSDFLGRGFLCEFPVIEPLTVSFRRLIPFRRIQPREPNFPSVCADAVGIGCMRCSDKDRRSGNMPFPCGTRRMFRGFRAPARIAAGRPRAVAT